MYYQALLCGGKWLYVSEWMSEPFLELISSDVEKGGNKPSRHHWMHAPNCFSELL